MCLLKTTAKLHIALLFFYVGTSSSEDILDYYWRDYTGIIPSDAVIGGMDRSGAPTYIGQMYYKPLGLLPATIYRGSKRALASGAGKPIVCENYVKILCTRNQYKFRWIPTKNDQTHLLTNCHLVVGGTEAGFVLNIGRVNHEMATIIGKVFDSKAPQKGLSIPNNTKEDVFQTYDILTYNCDINSCSTNITFVSSQIDIKLRLN